MQYEYRNNPQAPQIETRDDSSVISGYAAVYYDGTRATEYELMPGLMERIQPGAFDDRIGDDVRALFNHEPNQILGRSNATTSTLKLSVDGTGLRYEIEMADTTVARDVAEHLRRGDVSGSSFGFRGAISDWEFDVQRDKRQNTIDVRKITGFASLFDVGPVVNPAYTGTTAGARDDSSVESLDAYKEAKGLFNAEKTRDLRRRMQSKLRSMGL